MSEPFNWRNPMSREFTAVSREESDKVVAEPDPFDWHQEGVWMVCNPAGTPLRQTLSETPYGARAEFLRGENLRGKGYTVRGYVETERIDL